MNAIRPVETDRAAGRFPQPDGEYEPRHFHRTDVGNAQRLVAHHGKDLRYVPARKLWLVWDRQRFRVDETGEVLRRAKATARAILGEADNAPDDTRKAIVAHAMRSESD